MLISGFAFPNRTAVTASGSICAPSNSRSKASCTADTTTYARQNNVHFYRIPGRQQGFDDPTLAHPAGIDDRRTTSMYLPDPPG